MDYEFFASLPAPGLLGDGVMVVHALFVAFVVGGQIAVLLGWWRGWRWVRRPGFRVPHLGVIAYVLIQSLLGRPCPLTVWEAELRRAAGQAHHDQGFIVYWVGELLFLHPPGWAFTLGYSVFAALVAISWVHFPPRRRKHLR